MRLWVLVALLGAGLLAVLIVSGCQPEHVEHESSCVTCHSDEDQLKETGSGVEEVKSEATSGEG